jgi:VanZ family protein
MPAAGWAAVIFWLSSMQSTGLPGRFSSLAHFGAYAILAALLWWALGGRSGGRRAAVLAIVIASVYGITDEFHQSFVPGRNPDPADWAVDTLGAIVAALVLVLGAQWWRKRSGSVAQSD